MPFTLTATNYNGTTGATPPSNTVQEGDFFDLKLSLDSGVLSDLEYSWLDDEKDIVGDVDKALLGNKVVLNDAGDIVAVAAAGYITDTDVKTLGYVKVYQKVSGGWEQIGNTIDDIDSFKKTAAPKNQDGECTIAISDDGTILAIGEPYYDRDSTVAKDHGRVRLYEYTGGGWVLRATKTGISGEDYLGTSISMNSEGTRLIVGIPGEDTPTGRWPVAGAGAAEIYDISNFDFTSRLGQIIRGEDDWVKTGGAVSMNSYGNIIAVATEGYDDEIRGTNVGKVDLYELIEGQWESITQSIIGEAAADFSGQTLSLSGFGNRVAIGSLLNVGVTGTNSGHVRIYERDEETDSFFQVGDDIDGESAGDKSSVSLSLNNDGSRVAIGSSLNTNTRGHVRVFEYDIGDDAWNQLGTDIDGDATKTRFGHAVSLNGDGDKIAIGDRKGGVANNSDIDNGTISFYSYRNDVVRFSVSGQVNVNDIEIDGINTLEGEFVLDPGDASDSIRIDIEEDISNIEQNETLTFTLDDHNISLSLTIEDPANKSALIHIVDGDGSDDTHPTGTITIDEEGIDNQIWFRVTPTGSYGNNEEISIAISDSSQFINPITSVFTVSDGDPLSPIWFSLTAKADRATEGSQSIDVATGETTVGATNQVNFSINDTSISPIVNSITFDKQSVNEDDSITVTLNLSNVFEGDKIPVTLSSSSSNTNWPNDIVNMPTDFVVDNTLSASITLDIKKDDSIEIEAETITVTLGDVLTASDGTTYDLDSNSVLFDSFVINPSTFTLSRSAATVNERASPNTIDITLTTTFAKTGTNQKVPFDLTDADQFIDPPTEFSLDTDLPNVSGDFDSATSTITLTPKDDRVTEGNVNVTLTLPNNYGGESISFTIVDDSTDASVDLSIISVPDENDLYRALGSQIDFKIDTFNYSETEDLTIEIDTTVQDSVSAADIDGPLIQTLNTVLDSPSSEDGSVTGSIQTVASRFQHKSKVLKLDLTADGLVRESIQIRLYNDAAIKSSAIRGIISSAKVNSHIDVLLQASNYYDENDVLSYRYSLKDSGGNNIPVSSNLFHKSDEDYKDIDDYKRRVYSTLNEFRKARDTIYIKDSVLDEYGQGLNISLDLDNLDIFEQRGFDIADYFQNMTKGGTSVSLNGNGNILAVGVPLAKPSGGANPRGKTIIFEYIEEKGTWSQLGSDIDGESNYDQSGYSISLNEDGDIIAIGAQLNDGNGNKSGHVRVFEYSNGDWNQLGIDINGEALEDESGFSVSLSDSGERVAIGAYRNDGSFATAGHARIYEYSGGTWTQLGADIDGEAQNDQSGYSVSLSGDGNRVAIGAHRNDAIGNDSGHVRIYEYSGSAWSQLGTDIDGESAGDQSGISVSLNEAGDIVAIGAHFNEGSEGLYRSGHVKVYQYSEGSWTQLGSDIDSNVYQARFGRSVSLSADGRTLAVGGPLNDGNNPKEAQAKIFKFLDNDWYRIGQTIFSTQKGDLEGTSVSLSSDGNVVALGAPNFDSDSTTDSGLVRVFEYKNETINLPLDYGIPASAAFSLRNLSSTYTDDVVEVRRTIDGETEGFTADEVTDGTLKSFAKGYSDLATIDTIDAVSDEYYSVTVNNQQNFNITSNLVSDGLSGNLSKKYITFISPEILENDDVLGKYLVEFNVQVNSGSLGTGSSDGLRISGRYNESGVQVNEYLTQGFNSYEFTLRETPSANPQLFFTSEPNSQFDVTISNFKVYRNTVNTLPLDLDDTVLIYDSDYSVDNDEMGANVGKIYLSVTGGHNGISDGTTTKNGVLQIQNIGDTPAAPQLALQQNEYKSSLKGDIEFKYYVPIGHPIIGKYWHIGASKTVDGTETSYSPTGVEIVGGAWTTATISYSGKPLGNGRFLTIINEEVADGIPSDPIPKGSNGDVYYITDVKVNKQVISAAYSLRNLRSNYTGNVIRVRRSNNNDEKDFTADEVTDGTLENWVGTDNDGFIKIWYDQSSEDNHAVQTDPANQPKIVEGGVILDGINIDATNENLVLPNTSTLGISGSNARTVMAVMNSEGDDDGFMVLGGWNGNDSSENHFKNYRLRAAASDGTARVEVAGYNTPSSVDVSDGNIHLISSILSGTTTADLDISGDGTISAGADNDKINTGDFPLYIGFIPGRTQLGFGSVQELIIYNHDLSLRRRAVEENIANHYGVTLSDFSRDGTVSTWYDQSGRDSHLIANDPSEEPMIISDGSIVTDTDGKLALNGAKSRLFFPTVENFFSKDGSQSLFAVIDFAQQFGDPTDNGLNNDMIVIRADTGFQKVKVRVEKTGGEMELLRGSEIIDINNSETISSELISYTYDAKPYDSSIYLDGSFSGAPASQGPTNTDRNTTSILRNSSWIFDRAETVNTYISELIYYPSDISFSRTPIESNIANHYNINLYN